jgi:uncharacterized protein (DUF433 family)
MKFADYITRTDAICGGEPVIRGTRIPLRTVLASLAEGDSIHEIMHDYPTLTEDAARAAIASDVNPQRMVREKTYANPD